MRVSFIDVGGVRTRYYHEGAGPPLVLVHGAGASADTWVRNIDALGEKFAVYAPDLIGHGFTDSVALAGRAPQAEQVKHLCRFVDALGLDRYRLAGSSFGALIVGLWFFARPEQIAKLVLIGSASTFHHTEEMKKSLGGSFANQIAALTNPTRELVRKRNVGSNFDKSETFEEIILNQLTYFALPDRKAAYEEMHAGLAASADSAEYRIINRLEEIKLPTLIITGRDDPRAKWERAVEGQKRMPDAEIHIFDKCGHKPFVEHAARFNELVTEFLSR